MDIQNFSRRHINVVVQSQSKGDMWNLTGFYGHPEVAKRVEAWALMRHLANLPPEPWLCMSDFNEITSVSKMSSHRFRRMSQMQDFRLALGDCKLSDLGFKGPKYTWCNGRGGED